MVCILTNLMNFSVGDVKFYPKNKSKKLEGMVITNLGTQNGKLKVVIADTGLFAYENVLLPLNLKVKRNIDKEKLKKGLRRFYQMLYWFDSRYNKF